MSSYADIETKIIQWAEARRIIPNATQQSQLNKMLEEVAELFAAQNQNNIAEIKDAVGDVMVCLVNYCALRDINLVDCMYLAYDQIKDRKGTLLRDGTFLKQESV